MFKPSPVFWIVAGLVIAALEMVVPGFFIIWFGVAGVVTGILAIFIRNQWAQFGIFLGLSAVLVMCSRLIARRITKPEPEPVGAMRLVGVEGVVVRTIEPGNPGRVKVIGEEWRAEASRAIPAGTRVKVVRVEGTRVMVEEASERSEQ
ncbi:MAG: NfeD family protein [candidate division WOR-3 bacterium]